MPAAFVLLNEKFNYYILQKQQTDDIVQKSQFYVIENDYSSLTNNSLNKIKLILDWTGYLGRSIAHSWKVDKINK
jgi:hypothetical protein